MLSNLIDSWKLFKTKFRQSKVKSYLWQKVCLFFMMLYKNLQVFYNHSFLIDIFAVCWTENSQLNCLLPCISRNFTSPMLSSRWPTPLALVYGLWKSHQTSARLGNRGSTLLIHRLTVRGSSMLRWTLHQCAMTRSSVQQIFPELYRWWMARYILFVWHTWMKWKQNYLFKWVMVLLAVENMPTVTGKWYLKKASQNIWYFPELMSLNNFCSIFKSYPMVSVSDICIIGERSTKC